MKTLFYARDIRGGLGERQTFRTILRWLADHEPYTVRKNLALIPEYGRWDDLLELFGTKCESSAIQMIHKQLDEDFQHIEKRQNVSLLGKWLPSVNAHDPEKRHIALKLMDKLDLRPVDYRKILTRLRSAIDITENYLREKAYDSIDYEKQPSGAMLKYQKAFLRNDRLNYTDFLQRAAIGEAGINTGTLMPYELVRKILRGDPSDDERMALDVTWNALPDYCDGRNALTVIDGSGSMYFSGNPLPAEIALSLGIYFAEHNKGAFHNCFITFSAHPRLVEIKGKDLTEKVRHCEAYNECANTNIQRVFELLLNSAVSKAVKQDDMPETIYIISDMEFDRCTQDANAANFEYAEQLFKTHGYRLPKLVFWNIQSRHRQMPVSMNEKGVLIVSGSSVSTFSMVMEQNLNPYEYMLKMLNSERYKAVQA